MLDFSGTRTEGTSVRRLVDERAHWVPPSMETNSEGSAFGTPADMSRDPGGELEISVSGRLSVFRGMPGCITF